MNKIIGIIADYIIVIGTIMGVIIGGICDYYVWNYNRMGIDTMVNKVVKIKKEDAE